jgi:hypothetical protein
MTLKDTWAKEAEKIARKSMSADKTFGSESPRSKGLFLQQSGIEFIEFLKSGGEAEVWKVKERGMGRRVLAAKLVVMPLAERNERKNFLRLKRIRDKEAENWAKLDHCKNIVPFFPAIEESQTVKEREYLFIGFTMPLAELGDLGGQLAAKKLKGLSQITRLGTAEPIDLTA